MVQWVGWQRLVDLQHKLWSSPCSTWNTMVPVPHKTQSPEVWWVKKSLCIQDTTQITTFCNLSNPCTALSWSLLSQEILVHHATQILWGKKSLQLYVQHTSHDVLELDRQMWFLTPSQPRWLYHGKTHLIRALCLLKHLHIKTSTLKLAQCQESTHKGVS